VETRAEVFEYTAYGLNIKSELALPELTPGSDITLDVEITRGELGSPTGSNGYILTQGISSSETRISMPTIGVVLVKNGSRIVFDPVPGCDESAMRLFLLGPALGVVLIQRGYLVLHASAVASEDGVIAFLGDKGAGKSTTATAMYKLGFSLMVDDVLALDVNTNSEQVLVLPGFPQVKLWPSAAASLGEDPDELLELRPRLPKRARRIQTGFAEQPLPLKQIYILNYGSELMVSPVPDKVALLALLRHTYANVLVGSPSVDAKRHFHHCNQVVNKTRILNLKRPQNLSALIDMAELVKQNEQQLTPALVWNELKVVA
jgi:hypothetical protein